MAKDKKQPENEVAIEFPIRGVDLGDAVSQQRQGTTPEGVNVRGWERYQLRSRGGSRSGLSRYIDEKVNGESLIQHLNMIVDPTTDALQDSEDYPGADGIPDPSDGPRNPGRTIRPGGTGKQPNRNKRTYDWLLVFYNASPNAIGNDTTITSSFSVNGITIESSFVTTFVDGGGINSVRKRYWTGTGTAPSPGAFFPAYEPMTDLGVTSVSRGYFNITGDTAANTFSLTMSYFQAEPINNLASVVLDIYQYRSGSGTSLGAPSIQDTSDFGPTTLTGEF